MTGANIDLALPNVAARVVRLSEAAVWFIMLGVVLTVSGIIDILDGTTAVGTWGSLGVAAVGGGLLAVGLLAFWRSRVVWLS